MKKKYRISLSLHHSFSCCSFISGELHPSEADLLVVTGRITGSIAIYRVTDQGKGDIKFIAKMICFVWVSRSMFDIIYRQFDLFLFGFYVPLDFSCYTITNFNVSCQFMLRPQAEAIQIHG